MTPRSFPFLAAAALCAAPLSAQTLDQALEVFYANDVRSALPMFERLAAQHPDDADVRTWVAEARLRLEDTDAAIEDAHAALRMRPCHSAAHSLLASAYIRSLYLEPGALDSMWTYARRATECDAQNGNAWLNYWVAGILRRDSAAALLAAQRMAALGFLPEPVMERARWMLRSAPPRAVLVASGDWDFFPMAVAQMVEGLRPDVELVQRIMLEFPWYVRRVAARTGLPMPRQVEDLGDDEWTPLVLADQPLPQAAGGEWAAATLAGAPRPLVMAATADTEWVRDVAWPRVDGGVYTLHPPAPDGDAVLATADPGVLAASLRQIDVALLNGPIVHPTDRSPVRRTDGHPADLVLWMAVYLAGTLHDAGDDAGAREALALAEQLIATGRAGARNSALYADLRAEIEGYGIAIP